ncbi:MAG: hypothetical protein HZB91_04095 [Elusimicrobia bacterium]|nr:hypothetical protein [Elusimicrobiota bacterium]
MARPEPDEVLVGSGSFRIDPNRALEILRSRQFETEGSRMAFWIRAAVLRGAPRADFNWGPLSLTIRFGGKPLTIAELRDPFSCLLSGSSADPASRWLALALLHTGRPKVTIAVESGPPDRRRALFLDDNGLREARPTARVSGRSPDTIVKVSWPLVIGVLYDPRHPYCWQPACIRRSLEPCPIPVNAPRSGNSEVALRFEPVQPDKRGIPLKEIRKGGLRILLRPGVESGIRVRFCVAGVEVEGSTNISFPIPWVAWVDDPELELDASLKSAVQGERWKAALKAVEEAATAHSLEVVARHGRAMRLVGDILLLNPDLLREWKRLRRISLAALTSRFEKERHRRGVRRLLSGKLSGDHLRMLECALVCAHLRDPADVVLGESERVGRGPVKEGLWRVPLYFDCGGKPLSVMDLVKRKDVRLPL